jgi:ABC-type multidrug transport system ATPase subunit
MESRGLPPIDIRVNGLGKRFNRQWIFRNLTYQFSSGSTYAITGHNGSGKSTFLQILAGLMEKSEGAAVFEIQGKEIPPEHQYRYLSFSAPYIELIEEFSLLEFFDFHFSMKPILTGWSIEEIVKKIELWDARKKQIRQFSSGMKQRAKLGQAFFSNVPVVLLDEPTSNFDTQGINLYHNLLDEMSRERLIIICSNEEQEIENCQFRLNIADYTFKS